ncbi:protein phosphatase 1 regulatory subunit 3G [Eleutherodactylus coqui]|uniref:protein phosphatase 1 regulatory subunit 3G n=1 Tax=Eleutherodactylus coqui TaxID=57060 RepID=UPI0034625E14
MEPQSLRVPLAEQENTEPAAPPLATGHPPERSSTMNDWEEDEQVPGVLTAQQPEDLPEPALLRRLHALHLAEPASSYRYTSGRMRSPTESKTHFPDASYPEPLSTEESPRRRARSLPCNSIPEAEVEEDDDSILCCFKLKKKVQFADSLGLCLASVKHFVPSDEPLVPEAVLARLQTCPVAVPMPELPVLKVMAEIPAELLARLEEQRVCLEQVVVSVWGVSGYILVKDPEENAQVKVRFTFNEWASFMDCMATATQLSSAPGTQRFHFNLCYPPFTTLLHFAICLMTGHGQEIWDNNQGGNYTVNCQQNLPPVELPSREEQEGPRLW